MMEEDWLLGFPVKKCGDGAGGGGVPAPPPFYLVQAGRGPSMMPTLTFKRGVVRNMNITK